MLTLRNSKKLNYMRYRKHFFFVMFQSKSREILVKVCYSIWRFSMLFCEIMLWCFLYFALSNMQNKLTLWKIIFTKNAKFLRKSEIIQEDHTKKDITATSETCPTSIISEKSASNLKTWNYNYYHSISYNLSDFVFIWTFISKKNLNYLSLNRLITVRCYDTRFAKK